MRGFDEVDNKQPNEMNQNQNSLEQQLESQLMSQPEETNAGMELPDKAGTAVKNKLPEMPVEDARTLGVGEWMITILFFLLPIINIVVMAIWSFSSKGNIHRKNLSRACLLWLIILLIGYVVAMTVAGYTILDIFRDA